MSRTIRLHWQLNGRYVEDRDKGHRPGCGLCERDRAGKRRHKRSLRDADRAAIREQV